MTACPSAEQLDQLLDERLADPDRATVSEHVRACSRCQATLESLTNEVSVAEVPLSAVLRPKSDSSPPSSMFLARLKEQARPAAPARAEEVPGYEILEELGRGGMGVVYKARQVGLNRPVALKMLLAGSRAGPRDVARFRQEAEAVARLRHPNIVQVYEIGEAAGNLFIALEYVEGGSLVRHLRGDPQPILPTVRLLETLARAVQAAHEHGIIHRDLKPANVLLQISDFRFKISDLEGGARPGDFKFEISNLQSAIPKITDFGLAKRLDEESGGMPSGELVGTPSYMAPEQAASRGAPVGPAADVYALGAILYEMLTGRAPFKGATPLDTAVQVLHEEPVPPGDLRPDLPRDLETICLKCLQKEPARRYGSALALAEDLAHFRQGRPIRARPVGLAEWAWKAARRRPLPAALAAGLVLVTVLGFAGVVWQWREAAAARDHAETERQDAEGARAVAVAERSRARTALYYSRIAQSQLQWRVNDVLGAEESLAKCRPGPGQEDRRGWEWYYLQTLLHADLRILHHGEGGADGNVAYSPDGRHIVSVVGSSPTADDQPSAEVRAWDASTGEMLWSRRAAGTVHRLAYAPDGQRLALACTDGTVRIWDAGSGGELAAYPLHERPVVALAFHPDGIRVASAGWDQTVKIWEAATGRVVRVLRGHEGPVHSVAFHRDGRRLASGGADATIRIWDVTTGQELQTLRRHKSAVQAVLFSPDGRLLASTGSTGNLRVWDLSTGRVIRSLTGHAGAVRELAFHPDGRYLANGGSDGTVRIWDIESGVEQEIFRGHTAAVESVQFSPDGQRLVSSSPAQAVVKVWDFTRRLEFATFARTRIQAPKQLPVRNLARAPQSAPLAPTGPDLEALAFRAAGRYLVSVTVGGKLQTWDAATGVLTEERTLPLSEELVSPAVLAAFSPDGERLAGRAREDDRLVKIWDVATGTERVALRGHTLPVSCVRFSPDGHVVTCACDLAGPGRTHEVRIWDAATGQPLRAWTGRGFLFNAAFGPAGHWLALAGADGALTLVDGPDAAPVVLPSGHRGPVAALAFSPKGGLLASGGLDDGTVLLWDLDAIVRDGPGAQPLQRLTSPRFLCDLAFSPDGRRLVGASRDLLQVWDVGTGHDVLTLRGAPPRHWDPVFNPRVLFSPDGKRLLGTNWDETISLWDAEPLEDAGAVDRLRAARRQAAEARARFWHLQEAEDCLEHGNRPAARFHLRRLGSASLPPPLETRKARLEAQLHLGK